MKAIFDNNVWLSYAIGNQLDDIPKILLRKDVEMFVYPELLEEFERTRHYPKLQKYLKPARVKATIEVGLPNCPIGLGKSVFDLTLSKFFFKMTENLVLYQVKQLPENLKQEVLDFIGYIFLKYRSAKSQPVSPPNLTPKFSKPSFGCGTVKVWLAPDFDAPLDDFKDYMQ